MKVRADFRNSFESAELDFKEIANFLGRRIRGVDQRLDCVLRSGGVAVAAASCVHGSIENNGRIIPLIP
jgi:hypothetical protein